MYSNLFTSKGNKYGSSSGGINRKWGWLSLIDRLSSGDITKHKEVYEMNYIYCLNLLGYWHDRDLYIEEENKRNNKING